MKSSIKIKPCIRRLRLTQSLLDRKYLRDNRWLGRFHSFSDFKRMIYWADQPDGGIGVSFVDPAKFYGPPEWLGLDHAGFLDNSTQKNTLDEIFKGAKVLSISSTSESDLGRKLFSKSVAPFREYHKHWRYASDCNGIRIDDVLIGWSLPEASPRVDWTGNPIDYDIDFSDYDLHYGLHDALDSENDSSHNIVLNDFSNIPFNYVFLHRIVSDDSIIREIGGYNFFDDGQLVSTRFGYYSPAYAIALLQSLQKRNLVNIALKSFKSFLHYHPIDPITMICERKARTEFNGVIFCEGEIEDPRNMRHDYSMLNRLIEDFDSWRKKSEEFDDCDNDD